MQSAPLYPWLHLRLYLPMKGDPTQFEALGDRLGFRVEAETETTLRLLWQGVRFPAFLCLGIGIGLLMISVPIVMAIHLRGLTGPAGSLWYFPVMNSILVGVAIYLLSLKRIILIDQKNREIRMVKHSLFRRIALSVDYADIASLRLGLDQLQSGLAVAGSAPDERYPIPSLRLVLANGDTILLDRGGTKRLQNLAERMRRLLGKSLEIEDPLRIA